MTQANVAIAGAAPNSEKRTSLALAVILSLASLSIAFVRSWVDSFGWQTLSKMATVLGHPSVLSELVVEAAGASLFFPAVHVAIASLFKSKRNPSSRRRIFIGWGLLLILLSAFTLWKKSRGF